MVQTDVLVLTQQELTQRSSLTKVSQAHGLSQKVVVNGIFSYTYKPSHQYTSHDLKPSATAPQPDCRLRWTGSSTRHRLFPLSHDHC